MQPTTFLGCAVCSTCFTTTIAILLLEYVTTHIFIMYYFISWSAKTCYWESEAIHIIYSVWWSSTCGCAGAYSCEFMITFGPLTLNPPELCFDWPIMHAPMLSLSPSGTFLTVYIKESVERGFDSAYFENNFKLNLHLTALQARLHDTVHIIVFHKVNKYVISTWDIKFLCSCRN